MFHKKTIKDYDVRGKAVLVRVDFNVPIKDGEVTSDFRVSQTLPTIAYLQEQECKIILISHLGRPTGKNDTSCSLKPVGKVLSTLLHQPVTFVGDCQGEAVSTAVSQMKPRDIVLLENVRFYEEEEKNSTAFAQAIVDATKAEVFVQDAFGVVHRAHATTDAIAKLLPAVAGLLLEKEVSTLTNVIQSPEKPLMAIIGGAKIDDKIAIIHRFVELADVVVIGGAMANTFLKARGVEVGESLVDEDELDTARDVMERAREQAQQRRFIFYLPQDGVVTHDIDSHAHTRIVDWDAHVIASVEAYPAKPRVSATKVGKTEKIVDVGPFSGAFIAGAMQMVNTVVWNGTLGVTETRAVHGPVGPFAHGTQLVIDGLVGQYGHRPFSILGGGDTTGYIEERGLSDMFHHVSTGGGASLELLSGKQLPGVEALWDAEGREG